MTDEVALDSEAVPAQVDDSQQIESQQEKMLPVSRVEELVKKAKLKGRDSMQAELDALKAENDQLKNGGSMGGMAMPVDPNAITQQVMASIKQQMQAESEERAKQELEAEASRIAQSYRSKMSSGKDAYEDFDDVMADFNPQAFPNLVLLASQMDNTPDVMYELMNNPAKFGTIAVLSERDPQAAQRMLSRISQSIQANKQAKAEQKQVPEPISRLSSSKTGQDDGSLSVRDFKKMFRG